MNKIIIAIVIAITLLFFWISYTELTRPLELRAEQSAVKNTESILQIVNGTCEAWKCHREEGR